MIEHISLRQMREEWPGWAIRYKVGVIVMAVVVIGLSIGKLSAPAEKIVPVKPLYTPAHACLGAPYCNPEHRGGIWMSLFQPSR